MAETPTRLARGERRWGRRASVAVLLAVLGTAVVVATRAGRWLVVEDALEPAQAIVVLSGRMPVRAKEAAEIYRQGYAAEVWVTRSTGPEEELEQMGIPYVGEEFYNQRVLIHLGVPADAIRVLEKPVANTADEVDAIAAELERAGAAKAIVVTTKAHTRRVRLIWRKRVGNKPRAIIRYTSADDFDAERWWRRTGDALDVVREWLGLANAWAGFPLKPAS